MTISSLAKLIFEPRYHYDWTVKFKVDLDILAADLLFGSSVKNKICLQTSSEVSADEHTTNLGRQLSLLVDVPSSITTFHLSFQLRWLRKTTVEVVTVVLRNIEELHLQITT